MNTTIEPNARSAGELRRDRGEALALLREIVDMERVMMHKNDNASQEEFQQAADAFYAKIDTAAEFIDLVAEPITLNVTGGKLTLIDFDLRYCWFLDDADTGVSGLTVDEARTAAYTAWPEAHDLNL